MLVTINQRLSKAQIRLTKRESRLLIDAAALCDLLHKHAVDSPLEDAAREAVHGLDGIIESMRSQHEEGKTD